MIVSDLEHDEYGFASEDPVNREEMMLKRIRKFKNWLKKFLEIAILFMETKMPN